jgi:hypothetical protein
VGNESLMSIGYESITCSGLGLGLWCLMPLSTIFQLYHGVEKLKLFLVI